MRRHDFMKNMKLQFWSFDIIFAVVVFTVTLTVISFVWFDITNQLSLSYGGSSTIMQIQTQTLAYTLLSPGSPSYWEGTVNTTNSSTWNNISVGLGSGKGLSMKKIYTLMAMSNNNYQATKQALGIGYDYYIKIYNNNINITIGSNPITNNGYTVYVIRKVSSINGVPVTVEIVLWTGTAFGVA